MQNLSKSQGRALLDNSNVLKITESHVVFTPAFKIKATELFLSGEPPEEIFKNHGIDPRFFVPDFCRSCLRRWAEKLETQGKSSFKTDSRGSGSTGRPAETNLDSLSMDDLKAIIAIQEDMIEDLKKKKALAKKS
jgi:hypothetical protein